MKKKSNMPKYIVSCVLTPEETFYEKMLGKAKSAQLEYCIQRNFTKEVTGQYLAQSESPEEMTDRLMIQLAMEHNESETRASELLKERIKNGIYGGKESGRRRTNRNQYRYDCIREKTEELLSKNPVASAKQMATKIHPSLGQEGKKVVENVDSFTASEAQEVLKTFEAGFDAIYKDVRKAQKEIEAEGDDPNAT